MKEHITPEVGDVWQNKTGRLRVYITKVDVWGIIGISSSGAAVSKNMYYLEKYTYLGKSKANIADLFTDEGHIKADKLLLEYINDKEVTELFNKLPKWYE